MLTALRKNPVVDVLVTLVTAVVIAYVIQLWFVKPFQVPSESMVPTYEKGDYLLAARFLYHFTDPKRGDILVIHPNAEADVTAPSHGPSSHPWAEPYFVKRLVGLPNETIGAHAGHVWVCAPGRSPADAANPTATTGCRYLKESYIHGKPTYDCSQTGIDWGPVRVPSGSYLMLGDNRTNSLDSRCWGTILRSQIVGLAFMTYWPPTRISVY